MKYTLTTRKQIGSKREMENTAKNMFNNGTHLENIRIVEIKTIYEPVIKFKELK